ncbi:MerR family transcriptional regulator [Paenibacillus hodogayensis]|uniref:MerR family transcriptional regulator n=1 Tax=Paenibacillus hodogayensis TaxID=279208 RepID=A0ABV5VYY0_9BACL
MAGYLRGQLAKLADVHNETLIYYEKQGLLPPPERTDAGYRMYPVETLALLVFIKNAKACGFTLKEIKKSLDKSAQGLIGIGDFVAVIERKMADLDEEIAIRERTKARLSDLKEGLLAADKHPGVRETLRMLQMDS